jgi:hypothetical protein
MPGIIDYRSGFEKDVCKNDHGKNATLNEPNSIRLKQIEFSSKAS